jgi:hypothetical protein
LESESKCGYSKNGYSFCPIKEGDEAFTKTLQLTRKFWDNSPKCHISNPFGCSNAKKTTGVWTAMTANYEFDNYMLLQDNEKCVKSMLFADYWENLRPKSSQEIENQYIDNYNFASAIKTSLPLVIATLASVFILG